MPRGGGSTYKVAARLRGFAQLKMYTISEDILPEKDVL